MSDLFIGTSGYDYPEWKGVFYPDDLKRKDFPSFMQQSSMHWNWPAGGGEKF